MKGTQICPIVKLQSSLTVQSKSVGLGVDFVSPPSQQQQPSPKSTRRKCTTELKFTNKTKLIKSKSGEVPWIVSHNS